MALISATTLLRTISIFHITVAYYLLFSPSTIADQNLVYILGAAMDIPSAPPIFSTPSPALALASLVFALQGCSDLTATNLDEQVASFYWSSQAPIRLAFFLAITGYSYLWKPAGGALSDNGGARFGMGKEGSFLGGMLCNNVVFSWGFLEMLIWFWIFVKLRDEKRGIMVRKEARKRAEDSRL